MASPIRSGVDRTTATTTAEIHSARFTGAFYVWTLIDAATWLLSTRSKNRAVPSALDRVDIILHPVLPVLSLRRLRTWFANRLRAATQGGANREATLGTPGSADGAPTIADSIKPGGFLSIPTLAGLITIRAERVTLAWFSPIAWAVVRSVVVWFRAHGIGGLQVSRILATRSGGVPIGDLMGSTAVRMCPECGGQCKRSSALFGAVLSALAMTKHAEQIETATTGVYVATPEPNYLHAIYQRKLRARGATVIALDSYKKEFALAGPDEDLSHPGIVRRLRSAPLAGELVRRAQKYMTERVSQPLRHLPYMEFGANDSGAAEILDDNGEVLRLSERMLNAVVFLHSFEDVQYEFGLDGFDDLFDWTRTTITSLLGNHAIGQVLVKPHPAVDYTGYPGDRVALAALKRLFPRSSKLAWLKENTNIRLFANGAVCVAITHHGSVAEELVHLGVPVLASSHAPWGKECRFLSTWDSRSDYVKLLAALSRETVCVPGQLELNELYRFVVEYRLNVPSPEARTTWMKFVRWKTGIASPSTEEAFRQSDKALGSLRVGSDELRHFTNYLVRRHSEQLAEVSS